MKSDLKALAAIVTAVVLAPIAAVAQGNEVAMRVDFVGWGESIEGLALRATGGTTFTAQAFRYSKAQAYSGPAVMEIYQNPGEAKATPPPAAEDLSKLPPAIKAVLERRKTRPGLVALAALPAGSKRATVLMSPGPAGTYLTHVMDDDPSKLPVGRLRVHNLSPHPLALQFNGREKVNLPNQSSCVAAPINQELIYELAYQVDDEWKMLENNLVSVADDEQSQMVVLKSDSEVFFSSNGSRPGYLQVVLLRRSPREADVTEFTKAEREAAAKEAKRINDEMDEAAKPEAERAKKPKSSKSNKS
jgi:hypothetical protein